MLKLDDISKTERNCTMKDKLKNLWKKPLTVYVFLAVIIILQLVYLSCNFIFYKDGYHSDEIYSYGLSNSYHNPFLVSDNDIHNSDEVYFNINEWVSGDVFQDYVTVDADKTFDYENVWYNQSLDRHPPLYYAVLHTICSFFPEQFTPWFGFGLNLAVFAVLQIFVFLLSRKILKSNALALVTVICYGFSIGAVSTFVYIRMYAMVTMWIVILAYLHARLLDCKGQIKIKNLIPITIIVMLGTLTQHEFTIMAFVFAVCFCLYYLFKKQFKNFFKYGCSMLVGVLLAWAIFMPLMSQIFHESDGAGIDFDLFIKQFKIAVWYPILNLFGIYQMTSGSWIFLGIVVPTFIVVIIAFAIPICFLLRDNKKFIALKEKIKSSGSNFINFIKGIRPKKIIQSLKCVKKINILCLAIFAASIAIIIVAARTTVFWQMDYCDRYVFVVYPFALIVSVAFIYWFVRKIKIKAFIKYGRQIVAVLFILLLGCNVSRVKSDYFFEGTHNIGDLSEITADSDCIIVDYMEWRMECFSFELRNVNQVFYTTFEEIENLNEKMDALKTSKPVYVFLIADNADLENRQMAEYSYFEEGSSETTAISEDDVIEKYFSALNFYSQKERLGVIKIFAHNYVVYRIN